MRPNDPYLEKVDWDALRTDRQYHVLLCTGQTKAAGYIEWYIEAPLGMYLVILEAAVGIITDQRSIGYYEAQGLEAAAAAAAGVVEDGSADHCSGADDTEAE